MSERTASRLARILSVIPYVIEHDGATIADLQERFGYASDREVVKDLQLVFLTGLPGYGPGDLIDVDIFDEHAGNLHAEGVMHLPNSEICQPMRMLLVGADALGLRAVIAGEDHAVQTFGVGFVRLEAIGGHVTNINRLLFAVRHQ